MKRLGLTLLALALCCTRADAGVQLIQSPVGIKVTTALLTGEGTFAIKVPGTFAGLTSPVNARFLSYVEILADNPAMGDYVDTIVVSDDDGVIPAILRARYPSYPTIIDFSADAGVGTIAGFYLSQSGQTRIGTFPQLGSTGHEEPQTLPSGLYLKATIHNAGLLNNDYRINVMWGRVMP